VAPPQRPHSLIASKSLASCVRASLVPSGRALAALLLICVVSMRAVAVTAPARCRPLSREPAVLVALVLAFSLSAVGCAHWVACPARVAFRGDNRACLCVVVRCARPLQTEA
jgi:hypothetical protein